ncbi:DUF4012 domain-containing protein [Candidatus Daviesbacteria bacterium]|nr:DUF4012 domain-containing protein [Candidatus Daviesbacteria bacterium]
MINLTKKLERKPKSIQSRKKRWLIVSGILIFIFLITTFLAVRGVYTAGKGLSSHGKALATAVNSQNYDLILQEVKETRSSLGAINTSLNFLFWANFIPFMNGYYSDAKKFSAAGLEDLVAVETILNKLEPQKKELGFNNQPLAGQDRIAQGIKLLKASIPHLDSVEKNFDKASDLVKDINTQKYPEEFKGVKVRDLLTSSKNFIIGASLAVTKNRDALVVAPSALGEPSAKNYLMLFQNDKEIRPTGGFLTAFATLKVDRGQISTTTSDDIYRLDERLLATCESKICPLSPPAPIVKYLPEVDGKPRKAWSMRDSNISPDLSVSAKEFERMFQLLGQGLPFDGIIYIDTQVVEEIIEVTGPIEVLGTKYSAEMDKRCNCPNVIYELENYAEIAAKGEQDRKAILGVLMQQILTRALGTDVEKMPQLVETVARLANHKHVIFYMHDDNTQQALAKLNWIGEVKKFGGDYLHINDSNFAGGKSNLYVNQTVTQEINTQKNGTVKKKITIEYKNPQPFNTWLNGINRDYVRFYVPKGSKLLSSKGSEDKVNTIEDLDKTVFEAFVTVRPQNSRKLELEYEVPYDPKGSYKLMIQKQPGAKDFKYKIKLNGKQVEDFILDMDKEFRYEL